MASSYEQFSAEQRRKSIGRAKAEDLLNQFAARGMSRAQAIDELNRIASKGLQRSGQRDIEVTSKNATSGGKKT